MKCGFHDSETTWKGTQRKQLYIGTCGLGGSKEAKYQAIKDFNSQKVSTLEKIKPFKRISESSCIDWQSQEILKERQEYADAAFYYMRYIL